MLLLSAGLVLTLTVPGAAPNGYSCTSSLYTTRCACTSEAGCTQITQNSLCAGEALLCSVDGVRCTCSVSQLPLREVQPAAPNP